MKLKTTISCTINKERQYIRPDDPNLIEKLNALSDEDKLQLVQDGLIVDDDNQGVVVEGELDPDGEEVVTLEKTEEAEAEAKAKEEAEAKKPAAKK